MPPEQHSDEKEFRNWYASWVARITMAGFPLDPDPYTPEHFYDYYSAYKSGVEPDMATLHWPSEFKKPGSPEIFKRINNRLIDTRTGKEATPEAEALNTRIHDLILHWYKLGKYGIGAMPNG